MKAANRHPDSVTGMTLVETLIAAFVLGLVLLVVAEGTDVVRNQLRARRTWERLAVLNAAMEAYQRATQQWPGGGLHRQEAATRPARAGLSGLPTGGSQDRRPGARSVEFDAARRVLADLLDVEASKRVLGAASAGAAEDGADSAIQDGWGRRMRCLTAESDSLVDRQAVAASGGRPVFISDGPDGPRSDSSDRVVGYLQRSDEVPR